MGSQVLQDNRDTEAIQAIQGNQDTLDLRETRETLDHQGLLLLLIIWALLFKGYQVNQVVLVFLVRPVTKDIQGYQDHLAHQE